MLAGFSPRKRNLTHCIMSGFNGCDGLLARLDRHKTGVPGLYFTELAYVD